MQVAAREPPPLRHGALLWLSVFAIFMAAYGLTCQRGAGWQDSGRFQWRVLHGDYVGSDGLALAHPLYILIASAVNHLPFGSPIYRINLASSLGMAIALANLSLFLLRITASRTIALLGAAMLGVMHTAWWLSTIAEVYTWNAACLTLELLLLLSLLRAPSRALVAWLFFATGLDFTIHNLALLSLCVYAAVLASLVARRRLPRHSIGIAAGSFLVGGIWMEVLLVQDAMTSGLRHGVESLLCGPFLLSVVNVTHVGNYALYNGVLASLNFMSCVLPFAAVGMMVVRRRLGRDLAWSLLGLLCVHAVFVVRYFVPDQFTFLLPTLTIVVVIASVGVAWLWEMAGTPIRRNLLRAACVLCVILPPALYLVTPELIRSVGLDPGPGTRHPYRDEVRYWIQPWKEDEASAEIFAVRTVSWLERNAPRSIVLADSTSLPPLLLVQDRYSLAPRVFAAREGERLPRYDEAPSRFRELLDDRDVYLVSIAPGYVSQRLVENAIVVKVPGVPLYRLAGWRRPVVASAP